MKRRWSLAVAIFCWGALQAAETLAGGPAAVNVGPRQATITWVVQTSEAGLGLAPGKLDRGASALRFEKITYTGLEPGRTYYYNVLGRPEGRGRFKTAPAGRARFQFVAYGDTRTRHEVHRRVVAAILKAEPDFVLHTGDLVADGDDPAQWPVFFSIEKELLNKAAFFPAPGNHERGSRLYYDAFDLRVPYYSFDWGSAHFSVLNSDLGNVSPSQAEREAFWNQQLRWLERDLKAAEKSDLRFAMMHHPVISAVSWRQKGTAVLSALMPLFEKYRVQVVFCGHDHNYQHHLKNGVHYVVTGGGGAPLYAVDAPIPGVTRKAERVENFVKVRVDGAKASFEAFRPDGSLIERFQAP